MSNMLRRFRNRQLDLRRSDAGATAIEYAIIGALIGIGLIGSLVTTKTSLSAIFGMAATQMASGGSTAPAGPAFNMNNARAGYWQAKGLLAGQPTYGQNASYEAWTYKYQDGSSVYITKYKNAPLVSMNAQDASTLYVAQLSYYNGVISSAYENRYSDPSFAVSAQKYITLSDAFDANGVPTSQQECTPVNGSCSMTKVAVSTLQKSMVAASTNDFALFLGPSVTPQP
jgi:Flp pilus assembly pilin Flp